MLHVKKTWSGNIRLKLVQCKDTQNIGYFRYGHDFVKTHNTIYIIMYKLNLPPYDIKIKATDSRPAVYDVLRRKYVALTPEEWVRQHFVHFLISAKGYPQAYMANEVELKVGSKKLRCDSVLYDPTLRPRMIMEYKAPTIQITQNVFNQIAAYNMLLHVDYLVVSNGLQHYCCKMDYVGKKYLYLRDIPDYQKL